MPLEIICRFLILFQCSKVPSIYNMPLDIICRVLILLTCSKDPAIYDMPLDKICRFLILFQCSKDPAIYDMHLDKISIFLILFQSSKDPALYDMPLDTICIFLIYGYLFDFPTRFTQLLNFLAGVEEAELTLCTAWSHKHPFKRLYSLFTYVLFLVTNIQNCNYHKYDLFQTIYGQLFK